MTDQDILNLPEGGHLKYDLLEEIGQGTYGLVHKYKLTCQPKKTHVYFSCRAVESTTGKNFAIKIIENIEENLEEIKQEYQVLVEHSLHPNIPVLHGAYRYNFIKRNLFTSS